ncbi:MAG: PorT family protein [Bacteroidetes bacterium]|nr:PorT family protein [Bacteroidota bacterium]
MKRTLFTLVLFLASIVMMAQVVSEDTRQKFGINVAVFNDFWMDVPDGLDARFMNQGSNVGFQYNHRLGKSHLFLTIGGGLGMHNLYSNGEILDIKADTISFTNITRDYKKSKLSLTYLDIPFEFTYKSKKGFRMAAGFKAGYLISSHTKYKGDLSNTDGTLVKYKNIGVKQIEPWRYGPTFRVGYRWINVWAYYQLSTVFREDRGPEFYPISVGIMILPW